MNTSQEVIHSGWAEAGGVLGGGARCAWAGGGSGTSATVDETPMFHIAAAGFVDVRFLYAGYQYDKRLGLYHVRHRVYHPHLGRWLQPDPLGYIDGWNLYAYVGSSPMSFVDPWGLFSWLPSWIDDAATFGAGVGDALTFGLTDVIRDQFGWNDHVDKESDIYTAGEVVGVVVDVGIGTGIVRGAARAGHRAITKYIIKEAGEEVGERMAAKHMVTSGVGRTAGRHGDDARHIMDVTVRGRKVPVYETSNLGPGIPGKYYPAWDEILVRSGQRVDDLRGIIRHESVHAWFAPTGWASKVRSKADLLGYNRSHLLKFIEEAIAEGFATRSVWQGLRFPLRGGYDLRLWRIGVEGLGVGAGIIGIGRIGYEIGEHLWLRGPRGAACQENLVQ